MFAPGRPYQADKTTMPQKKILTVGFQLASDETHEEPFLSSASLLDWDIVMFKPDISDFLAYGDTYKGKPCLTDTNSFELTEACEHWRREIKQAIESRKTVIFFLTSFEEVYIDTGQRQYSGTGRNRQTTRMVGPYSNYKALPLSITPVPATGSAMKLVPVGAEILAPFWAEFGPVSEYKVLLPSEIKQIVITTRHGEKPVGAIIRSKDSSGALILLPDIDFDQEEFPEEQEGEAGWSAEAQRFAARMTASVVALDKALHSAIEITAAPDWTADPAYVLAKERDLRAALLDAERQVEEANKQKEEVLEELRNAARLRGLLYEKGKPLENATIEALKLLGFEAAPYKEADSEFDVVFECAEGRFIGEAEGKDTKPINVDKLRQLEMNIHEDLQREEVNEPAKGVLFGNGYRLSRPAGRHVQFTEKCITASKRSSTALVATSDLFVVAQYLSDQADADYAKQCRVAILGGVGAVALPAPPSGASSVLVESAPAQGKAEHSE